MNFRLIGKKQDEVKHSIIRVIHKKHLEQPCKLFSVCSCGGIHPIGKVDKEK